MSARTLALFEAYGIEIEYMIVDSDALDVRSLADRALREQAGTDAWVEDAEDGEIAWSNELVSHVIELKTNGPAPTLEGVADRFDASVGRLAALLAEWNARLMPSGMHPWMVPAREARLWTHGCAEIYRAYDALYDCRRHGWANVQSVHLNLPFADEAEFERLMAAVRVVLPLVPGLAASSPVVEGVATGWLDNRLDFYRSNAARTPAMAGAVIPEPVFGFDEYQSVVLDPIARELEAIGADAALVGNEWTNARGAIARFDRMAIEIRLLDVQECPRMDLGLSAAVAGLVRGLVEERWCSLATQRDWPTEPLVELFARGVADGPAAPVGRDYARLFALGSVATVGELTVGELLAARAPEAFDGPAELEESLEVVLREGTLAERILAALGVPSTAAREGVQVPRERLREVYARLCDCLAEGRCFRP